MIIKEFINKLNKFNDDASIFITGTSRYTVTNSHDESIFLPSIYYYVCTDIEERFNFIRLKMVDLPYMYSCLTKKQLCDFIQENYINNNQYEIYARWYMSYTEGYIEHDWKVIDIIEKSKNILLLATEKVDKTPMPDYARWNRHRILSGKKFMWE